MAREAETGVPVTRLCLLLEVNRRGYYRWLAQRQTPPTPRQQEREDLTGAIALLFFRNHERPGRRPMQILLRQAGFSASLGRIDRLMRGLGLQARRGRRWRHRGGKPGPSPALTAHITNHCLDATRTRDFQSTVPGRKTVGDITTLPTGDGPQYLATVLDLATRRVVGWATATAQDTTLTVRALSHARTQNLLVPDAIFHSDRGTQYTSHPFQQHCATLTVTQSMGATGVCYDNAVAEAFFAALKGDLRSELRPTTPAAEVQTWLAQWIDEWYNTQRPHSANHGLPPTTAWDRLVRAQSTVTDP